MMGATVELEPAQVVADLPYTGVSGSQELERPSIAQLHPEWRSARDLLEAAPPTAGLKRAPDGTLYRETRVHTGEKVFRDGQLFNVVATVRRPVALSIEEARRTGADYWSPSFGWIRAGRKREQEHPANMGDRARPREIELEPASPEEQAAVLRRRQREIEAAAVLYSGAAPGQAPARAARSGRGTLPVDGPPPAANDKEEEHGLR